MFGPMLERRRQARTVPVVRAGAAAGLAAMLLLIVSPAAEVARAQPTRPAGVGVPTSFSTSMMSVWTATNTTLAQGELVPISGRPPSLGTGSPKVAETGSIADAVATTSDGRVALVSAGDGFAGDAYLVSLASDGSAACNTGATDPDAVAVSPNGEWGFLADAAPDVGALYTFSLSGGGCSGSSAVLSAGTGEYAAVAVCPDGNTVVAADATGVLDIDTGLDLAGGPSSLTWTQATVPVGNAPAGVACTSRSPTTECDA